MPYLIVVAKGAGGLTVIQNIPDYLYHLKRIPNAIPWDSSQEGRAFDVRFLDLEPIQPDGSFGDNVDDHLFVAVGDHPVIDFHSAQDRLYKIEGSGGGYIFTEVVEAHAVLPLEEGAPHYSQTVISTKSLDAEGNLYLILAGGFYGDKQTPTPYKEDLSTLRVLKYVPNDPDPGKFRFEAYDIDLNGDEIIDENDNAVMMDVDVINANPEEEDPDLDDILISSYDRGPMLLINDGSSPPGFDLAEVFPTYPANTRAYGAAVADFDYTGGDDFILLLFTDGGSQKIPTLYENKYPQAFVEHAIVWLDDPADPNSPNAYRYKYPLLASKRSYEAVAVEHENRIDTIIVAAELPYYLIRDPYSSSDPFAFREWTLERSYSTLDIPTLSGPMLQVYTSVDLLVTDLTGDGREDVILSDLAEQNRLWYCAYSDPPYRWLHPLWDYTSAYFPAGGQYSTRVLLGDLYDETPWPDLVVAINYASPPNIYNNHYEPGQQGEPGTFSLINWNIVFPEDEWKNKTLGGQGGGGGWDGALVDLNSDDKLDLVIAQGRYGDLKGMYNTVYLWNSALGDYGEFERKVGALPEPPEQQSQYVTRGVAAGLLNDDACPDLVFAENTPRYVWEPKGLKLYFNKVEGSGPDATCKAEFGTGVWLGQGIAFRAVALIEYDGGRLPDIIAGDESTIYIYRNDGDGGFSLERSLALNLKLQKDQTQTDPGLTRFIPMNFDDPNPSAKKDDFFVAVQGGDNVILQAKGDKPRTFEAPIYLQDASPTWGAAVYDFDFTGSGVGDGYDDVLTFGEWHFLGHTRVYKNNCAQYCSDPENNPALIEMTGDFFLPAGDPWEYNIIPEFENPPPYGMRNPDNPRDGLVADIFGPDGIPEILIVGDGQNRLLLAESYKNPGSGVGYSPPGDAGTSGQGESEFLMMSGLVGLLPPDLAIFLDPNWLPAPVELPRIVE